MALLCDVSGGGRRSENAAAFGEGADRVREEEARRQWYVVIPRFAAISGFQGKLYLVAKFCF